MIVTTSWDSLFLSGMVRGKNDIVHPAGKDVTAARVVLSVANPILCWFWWVGNTRHPRKLRIIALYSWLIVSENLGSDIKL